MCERLTRLSINAFGNALGDSVVSAMQERQLSSRVAQLKERFGLAVDGRVSNDVLRALLGTGVTQAQMDALGASGAFFDGLQRMDRGAGDSDESVNDAVAAVLARRGQRHASPAAETELDSASVDPNVLQLPRVHVTGISPLGPSSRVIDLMTGGYQVVAALSEAYEKYGLLAEAGYVAARTVLTGGPLKNVALGLARVAEGELLEQASSMLSARVERTINEFVTDMGWTADVQAMGTSVHLGAADFGQMAGMLGGTVVDTVFGASIEAIGKRAGAMSQVVERAGVRAILTNPQAKYPDIRLPSSVIERLGPAPADMKNAHRHHILEVNGREGPHRAMVREGQDILRGYDIDPLHGVENLTWAPNKGHTLTNAESLVNDLRAAKSLGEPREVILKILREAGQAARSR
jgi:hypothetical protein